MTESITLQQITAFHEAGHVLGYWSFDLPIRYVTIRPRKAGCSGLCRPWRPRLIDRDVNAVIAMLGPLAEATFTHTAHPELGEFDDHLTGAVLAGGHSDLESSDGLLDSVDACTLYGQLVDDYWPALTQLAERLIDHGTVSGRDAFAFFTQNRVLV